jgi:uncharacterized membrane protein
MIDVSAERTIRRPLDEVFAYMAELDSLPQWLSGCRRAWVVSGDPCAVGGRVAHEDEFMGRRFETEFDVVGWEPNESMTFQAISGPMRGRSHETFESEGPKATRVCIEVRGELSGPLKAANWIAQRAAQAQLERSLDRLKEVLESEGS